MDLQPFPSVPHEPEDFLAYLVAAKPRTRQAHICVGRPKLSGDCPASRWLIRLHHKAVTVGSDVTWIGEVAYVTPDWLREFQIAIDRYNGEITAAVAIEILELILSRQEARAA